MSATGSKIKLYSLLAIVLLLAAGSLAVLMLLQQPYDGPSLELEGTDGTTRDVTLHDLQLMPVIERFGSYENSYGNLRGQGHYKGARLSDLVEMVGGMGTDDLLIINATDGYSQTFTYSNVYPNTTQSAIQGDMVIAYEYNQTLIPEYEEGPRIMFLPEDGLFSNDDANLTIAPEFFLGAAGPKLVSNVAEIIVIEQSNNPILDVIIDGITSAYSLSDLMQYEEVSGLGGFKNRFGSLNGPYTFTGISIIDLMETSGNLPSDYTIVCSASDGYEITYNHSQVNGVLQGYNSTNGDSIGITNFTMIIAYLEEGSAIVEDGPLRIVLINEYGFLSDSFLWLKSLTRITLST